MMRKSLFAILIAAILNGCGYAFQGTRNPWKERGLEKVYVDIITNNSLRSGSEVPFTSAFVKAFSRGNKLTVVSDKEKADIVVQASIDSITSAISSNTTVPSLTRDKEAEKLSEMVIATEYVARASVSVRFLDTKNRIKPVELLSQTFDKQKIYPGNNRFGLEGSTSVLINDSQLQMALGELAQGIASDAYDTMLESF